MTLKDVPFWCIVLAITVAMTIRHIFDCNIIEGQTEMDNSESDGRSFD